MAEEGWHTTQDGAKLYTKTWKAEGPLKARMVFVHGFSDHSNTSIPLFETLASKGIETRSFDQRGWGRSVTKQSEKGKTGTTERVMEDISSFLRSVLPSSAPLFLMGHSMGGAEVIYYAATGPKDIRKQIAGYLIESPLIALPPETKPSSITVALGRLASKIVPHRQMVNPVKAQYITRDQALNQEYVADKLCHDTGTLEGLGGMLDRAAEIETYKVFVGHDKDEVANIRIWAAHGTEDKITSYDATKKWFDSVDVKDKEFKSYEGWYHKLHTELGDDKYTFANDVAAWILVRSNGDGSDSKAHL